MRNQHLSRPSLPHTPILKEEEIKATDIDPIFTDRSLNDRVTNRIDLETNRVDESIR